MVRGICQKRVWHVWPISSFGPRRQVKLKAHCRQNWISMKLIRCVIIVFPGWKHSRYRSTASSQLSHISRRIRSVRSVEWMWSRFNHKSSSFFPFRNAFQYFWFLGVTPMIKEWRHSNNFMMKHCMNQVVLPCCIARPTSNFDRMSPI